MGYSLGIGRAKEAGLELAEDRVAVVALAVDRAELTRLLAHADAAARTRQVGPLMNYAVRVRCWLWKC